MREDDHLDADKTLQRPVTPDRDSAGASDEMSDGASKGDSDGTAAGGAEQTLNVQDRRQAMEQAQAAHRSHLQRHDPLRALVGQTFGDYELLSVIAKGGMGVVYKARQRKLNRIVALKMILAGQLADRLDVDRFYAEAEAAGNIHHRHIVGIHEIGEVEGQHFFSMEFVDGVQLGDLSREHPLDPRTAARYVLQIARAMQYAHDKGILHRDLKPANILVDQEGEPRITDFGLAKRVEGESALTMTGTIVGTPSYMPPEQASGDVQQVGTWSDIYSTGAILYELLTGAAPFRASSPFETIRLVLQSEPVAPRVLNPAIPRDLETICLKAMQKTPAARYASEGALADELQRFLDGMPIRARPISRVARTWRWCRRNPVVAGLSTLAVMLLVATLTATTVGFVTTRAALRESNESFRQARNVVDDLFTQVSEDTLLNQPGLQPLRHDLLRRALDYYEKFLAQRGDDPAVREELAGTYLRVGLIKAEIESPDKALPWYDKALQLQRQANPSDASALVVQNERLGEVWNAIGRAQSQLRNDDQARHALQEAARLRRQVYVQRKEEERPVRLYANSLMNLGLFERERQHYQAARQLIREAQGIRDQFLAANPDSPKLVRDHAMGSYNLGIVELFDGHRDIGEQNLRSAIKQFGQILTAEPDDMQNQYRLATCRRVLGDSRSAAEDLQSAATLYDQALATLLPLATLNPTVLEYQVSLAEVEMSLGVVRRLLGQLKAARRDLESAQSRLERLVLEHAEVPRYVCNLAVTARELAIVHAMANEKELAGGQLRIATEAFDRLVDQFPKNPEYLREQRDTQSIAAWLAQLP